MAKKKPRTAVIAGERVHLIYEVEMVQYAPLAVGSSTIKTSADAVGLLRKIFPQERIAYKEMMYVLLLNRRNACIGFSRLGVGTSTAVMCSVKEVAQLCVKSNASGVILAHNHPSGDLEPSYADSKITANVKEALQLFECVLLDHLILTSEEYFSFSDQGLL